MRPIAGFARSILEGIPDAVCVLDLNHQITYLNPAAEHLTLWSPDQVIGRTCDEVFGDELRSVADPSPIEASPQPGLAVTRRLADSPTRRLADSPTRRHCDRLGGNHRCAGLGLVAGGCRRS